MRETPFYAAGLRFSCTRCSACCRYDSGFVFLSENDVSRLAAALRMEYTEFIKTYCRWVPAGDGDGGAAPGSGECLSLKEKSNYDCVFWNKGCAVYDARPVQCRTFPFWRQVVSSSEGWELAGSGCPGIGGGVLRGRDEIEACLAEREREPPVCRKERGIGGI